MRIFITGMSGQLGRALKQIIVKQGFTLLEAPEEWDITDHNIVPNLSLLRPDVVIHTAAMTDVDGCAKDPDAAFKVNAFGSQNIAHACLRANADMVYISTNEVFDGLLDRPYQEHDSPNPINPYGYSKRSGEQMTSRYIKNKLYIVRTAWLYGPGGNNFPSKIMAAADEYQKLRVVTDEVSNPTYTIHLAEAIAHLIQTRAYGIYHLANQDYCSRYDFAKEILHLSGREDIPIEEITLAEYERASTVPPFTPLANIVGAELGIELPSWQEGLQDYFKTTKDTLT